MDYKFSGLELTPAIFRELLLQLFDGKQFSRQDAIAKVKKYHFDHGGLLGKHLMFRFLKRPFRN
ncbi:hypothetical protein [Limosilactobacillus sp.]|uniref:hypothetical protein n=1 Tax=Limosilactobacillus sp. TaxID=2773925 RepID=UPI0025BFF866|nr:hypothetical protein [Limosilactobacillus sp.]MCH3923262.1 hypothetical protein [Limosilactobacillus sp.]MCH3927944.1 hypothetical protein [Limosilactobacillus sp.]